MSAIARLFLILGGVNAALVVALGAFGAHGLKPRLSGDMMAVYHTATLYHAIHALGLIAVGVVAAWLPRSGYLKSAGWTMFAGIVLFCGTLYLLSVTGARGTFRVRKLLIFLFAETEWFTLLRCQIKIKNLRTLNVPLSLLKPG